MPMQNATSINPILASAEMTQLDSETVTQSPLEPTVMSNWAHCSLGPAHVVYQLRRLLR